MKISAFYRVSKEHKQLMERLALGCMTMIVIDNNVGILINYLCLVQKYLLCVYNCISSESEIVNHCSTILYIVYNFTIYICGSNKEYI